MVAIFYSPLDLLVDTGGRDLIDADDLAATLSSLRGIAVAASGGRVASASDARDHRNWAAARRPLMLSAAGHINCAGA